MGTSNDDNSWQYRINIYVKEAIFGSPSDSDVACIRKSHMTTDIPVVFYAKKICNMQYSITRMFC